MLGKGFVLVATLIIATSITEAREIYKTIGPDGKVTFSNTPPVDSSSSEKLDVIRTQTESLQAQQANKASAKPDNATDTSTRLSGRMGAKEAIRAETGPSISKPVIALATQDPGLEKAVIGVLGYESLVQQTTDLCLTTLPTSFKKYSTAADNWKTRNTEVVRQAHRALVSGFDSAQQRAMQESIRSKNNNSLAPIVAATTASKIKWCDSSSDEINNGAMDVHNKANLSAPLQRSTL